LQPGNAFARRNLEWVLGEEQNHWKEPPGDDLPPWLFRTGIEAVSETQTE
jgi:hypothetical protein